MLVAEVTVPVASIPAKVMDATPNLAQLRRAARERGQLIVKSPNDGPPLYALVTPDFQHKGTDPGGERAALAAFSNWAGMTMGEIAQELGFS